MAELHIIEPTLADQAGHCHSYVQSLMQTNQQLGHELHLWLAKQGRDLYPSSDCHSHPYFSRRFRQWQKFFCLRRLLRTQKVIFIPTAGRIDFLLLDRLLHKNRSGMVFLHFHQFKITPKKLVLLKKIAQRHSNLVILAPTQALLDIFQKSGFAHCELVPCPGYAPQQTTDDADYRFNKLLYAGAARADKGFPELVEFVQYLRENAIDLPLTIQVSAPHSGRYDDKSAQALQQLKNISLPNLILHEQTLDKKNYQNLFKNAICLLIYDPVSYRDKFSGVALDAFYAGSPVIAMAQTWAGEVTERFQAGVVLTDHMPESIYQAIEKIRQNYPVYGQNAKQAGRILQQEHDPMNTWRAIEKYLKPGKM